MRPGPVSSSLACACLVGLALPAFAQGPSFDCNKARHADEFAICQTPILAQLDRVAAAGYAYLKADYGRQFADQIGIPAWRARQACGSDVGCIRDAQIEAINAYRAAGAPVEAPAKDFSAPAESDPGPSGYLGSEPGTGGYVGPVPTAPPAPDEEFSSPVSVPLEMQGGTFVVPVTINGRINLNFTIDSGASSVVIPADVFGTLIRTGTIDDTDLTGKRTFTLADGRTETQETFHIRSLRVGDRVLHDVEASVAPAAGEALLGQSFLRRFRSWSIDNERSALVLH